MSRNLLSTTTYCFTAQLKQLILLLPFALLMQVANAQFTVSLTVAEPSCFGLPTGSIAASAAGGTAPYSYLWSTGAAGATLSNIAAGSYSVTVTDGAGAAVTQSAVVGQPTVVAVTLSANTCQVPFLVIANGSGGNPPYAYSWSTGASGSVINAPGAGTYCVTITDQNLCGAVNCITVNLNPVNVSVSPNGLTCPDSNDGEVLATVTGGTPPYTYAWSNGASTAGQTGLPPGSYAVTVTDSSGCSDSASGTVTAPPPLTSNVTGAGPDCIGGNNGSATASASGGTPPYSFLWSNGAITAGVSGLAAGAYAVTVTDANGCDIADMITLDPISSLAASATATPESCPGADDGTATATALNGIPPYLYLWSNGDVSQTITNLSPGTYTVTVIDGAGCTASATAEAIAAPSLAISLSATGVTACGGADGTATVDILDGLAPFAIAWSTGASATTVSGLAGGTYGVTVADANGCTESGAVVVSEPPSVSVTVTATPSVCPGDPAGMAAATVSGGTMPFSYAWNTGDTGPALSNLPAGSYSVTVTDANGCQDTGEATIQESPQLQVTVDGTEAVCGAGNTGEATAAATGGTPPYTYQWNTGETTESIDGLTEGTYTVSVTDAGSCTATATFTVDIIDDFTVIVAGRDVLCQGGSTGSLQLAPGGGVPPYAYLWNTGATTNQITGLTIGTYSVTITEASGCSIMRSITITEPPALNLSVSGSGISCPGSSDGAAAAMASGGRPPYAFFWSNGASTSSIGNLATGPYAVTVADANGCTATASIVIDASDSPSCSITVTQEVTTAGNDGQAHVDVIGGTAPFSYLWSDGQATATAAGLAPGGYSVVVTDANGCETSCSVNLAPPATVCVNITDPGLIGYDQFLCGPGNDPEEIISIVDPSGGVGAIEYLWMKSTVDQVFNNQTWMPIPGADGPSYDPPALYETTYFTRCVRRENCTLYEESNVVAIEVGDAANAVINAPAFLCVGEPTTLTAGPTGPGAVISWEVYGDATPASGTGPDITVTAASSGIVTVVLYVSELGCDAHNFVNLTATASPLYCGGQNRSLPINVAVTNEEKGEVMVSWMMEQQLAASHAFTVEYSVDGAHFEAIGERNTPAVFLGSMNYYEFPHLTTKRGRNFYRIKIHSQYGEIFFSEMGEATLYNNSELALLYPNPTNNHIVLELFENFGQEVQVEIFTAGGTRMHSRMVSGDARRAEFDLSGYPAGVYFFSLRYSRSGVKVLRVLKR